MVLSLPSDVSSPCPPLLQGSTLPVGMAQEAEVRQLSWSSESARRNCYFLVLLKALCSPTPSMAPPRLAGFQLSLFQTVCREELLGHPFRLLVPDISIHPNRHKQKLFW